MASPQVRLFKSFENFDKTIYLGTWIGRELSSKYEMNNEKFLVMIQITEYPYKIKKTVNKNDDHYIRGKFIDVGFQSDLQGFGRLDLIGKHAKAFI